MEKSNFDGVKKNRDPLRFRKSLKVTPDRLREKKRRNHYRTYPALVQKKEMLPTIHQGTKVEDSYDHPAVLVAVPSDSCIYYLHSLSWSPYHNQDIIKPERS